MELYTVISENFDTAQLTLLCAKLHVDYEDLPGSVKTLKALNLQEYMRARNRTNELLVTLKAERPFMDLKPYLYLVLSEIYSSESALTQLYQQFGLTIMNFGGPEALSRGALPWRKDKAEKLQIYMEENGRAAELTQVLEQKGADLIFYNPVEPPPPPAGGGHSGAIKPVQNYANFDIRLTPQGDGKYTADVLESPRGETKAKDQELKLDSVQTLLKFLRNKGAAPAGKVEELGQLLSDAIFPAPIMDHMMRSLEKAKDTGNNGMRVRLRFGLDQADLMKLPWEYCHDKRSYLALSPSLPFVRYLETATSYEPVAMPAPVKILVAIASPTDYATLKVDEEVAWIESALQGLKASGHVEYKIIEHATSFELFKQIHMDFKPHIFHFIGHGDFDRDGLGALVLEDGKTEPKAQLFNTKDMLQMLAPSDVNMVFLSACLTATFDSNDALMGIAPTLVVGNETDGHIPAVVGMQFPVPDQTAITFSRVFYESLADGEPLDAAITKARMGVYFSGTDKVFWGIPVLFMRSKDGVIWQK